jgi:hypothetical protein
MASEMSAQTSGRISGASRSHGQREQTDTEALVGRLHGVDLTAGTSRVSDDPFRAKQQTAKAAYGAAVVQALGSRPAPGGSNLLAAYARWRAAQRGEDTAASVAKAADPPAQRPSLDDVERARANAAKRAEKKLRKAREAAALAGPALEEHAKLKAQKAMRRARAEGVSTAGQLEKGWRKYSEAGGRMSRAAFVRSHAVAS